MVDPGTARRGYRGARILNQPPAGDGLVGHCRGRPPRYHTNSYRPLAQHDTAGRELGQLKTAKRTWSIVADAEHARFGTLGRDRQCEQPSDGIEYAVGIDAIADNWRRERVGRFAGDA